MIFVLAYYCSKNAIVQDCFDLVLQLFYQEYEILSARTILDWITTVKSQVEGEEAKREDDDEE